MIKKIIASDIDGTLLPYGDKRIAPKLFEVIKKLRSKGVLFVPASGRTIQSLEDHFSPVKDDISYLSENGCVVWHEDEIIDETPIPESLLADVVEEVTCNPGTEAYITTGLQSYVLATDPARREELRTEFSDSKIISSLEEIDAPVVKTTAICYPEADAYFPYLRKKFEKRINVAKAGPNVVDFTVGDKGDGLKKLTEHLGLTPEDVYAFGDNYNDVPMFKYAGNSYLIETDDPELKASANHMIQNAIDEIELLCSSF